ncbi:hypothetical protein BGZ61DRAFT_398302 [Ilyonectria robusta]|uniref:uncharacterized protein n=1 Tax=Ilyonectria robusta TaxID=1079257 RepID=UPI001E8E5BE9|nr:uncharacterized protein BGZ61DRAFT_398302 [Ilyonectria robusta]KAH8672290.1 hypothetical protein BGZ61DRAFT_398302 [Ilyonectria robusta]
MAEALGIAAGIVQLVDISGRIILASSQLYRDLKNVPDEIETLKRTTQQFIGLLQLITLDLNLSSSPPPETIGNVHVTTILDDAIAEATELADLLERLSSAQKNAVKRAWVTIVSMKKQSVIMEKSRRIESLKCSLQLWYQQHTASKLGDQMYISYFHIRAPSTRHVPSPFPQPGTGHCRELRPFELNQWQIPTTLVCTCRPVRNDIVFSLYGFQLFLSQSRVPSNKCPLKQEHTTLSFGARTMNPRLQFVLNMKLGRASFSMGTRISPHNVVDRSKSPAFVAIDEARLALWKIRNPISPGTRFPQDPKCTFITDTIPQTWMTSQNWILMEPDDDIFEDFMWFEKNVYFDNAAQSIIQHLLDRLILTFECGQASPADQDFQGFTLLHEVVQLSMFILPAQESLHRVLDLLVELLIRGGADPNATGSKMGYESLFKGSPLGLLAKYLRTCYFSARCISQLRLDRILVKYGCDVSDLTSPILHHPGSAGLFLHQPALLLDENHTSVQAAVINRSEEELRKVLDLGASNLESSNPPILTLAVGWPRGLQLLIDAGVDLTEAVQVAIMQQDESSLELLLDNGCALFIRQTQDSDGYSLLGHALETGSPPKILSLLVRAIAVRRRELYQLAIESLSSSSLHRLLGGWKAENGQVPDYYATAIFNSLEKNAIDVPDRLWPGELVTIYDYGRMTLGLAESLYTAGFHDIDTPGESGATPLQRAFPVFAPLDAEHCRLIQWYLNKGANPRRPFRDFPNSLHLFSYLHGNVLTSRIWDSTSPVFDIFKQVQKMCGLALTDSCNCWCSSNGCSPTGLTLRSGLKPNGAPQRGGLIRRRRWLCHLPRYSLSGLNLKKQNFTDVCRLEIFDRLGMGHTCCNRSIRGRPLLLEERLEVQEEDRELKVILDAYVDLYLELLDNHEDKFETSWVAWWVAIEEFLPFEWPDKANDAYPQYRYVDDGIDDEDRASPGQTSDYGPDTEKIARRTKGLMLHLDGQVDRFLSQFVQNGEEFVWPRQLPSYDED